MNLTLSKAVVLALVASVLPACDRGMQDVDKGAGSGATAGQTPAKGATGQASEGSTDDRKAPSRPSSR
jgi:hypothetical protein